jgi:hypothetical protein
MVLSTTAFAAESRGSNFFGGSSVYFWKSSGNNYQIWFDVTAVGTMAELGVSEIIVERSTDLSNWSTVRTYYKSSYPQMTDTNTAFYSNYVPFTATNGYYYRAVVILYARNSSGTGNMIETTDVLNLR